MSKTPWAPCSFALSNVNSSNSTGMFFFIFLFTRSSIAFFSSSVNFRSKLKSKRNLSGVMFEPRWKMSLSFRTSLSA